MDFSKLKAITIPEGNVVKLVCGDVILWQRLLSKLPKEYQELEYISADVNSEAYFDLGFAFDTKAKIYMMQKIGTQVAGNNGYIFGAAENSGKLRCMLTSPFKSNGGSSLYGSDGSAFNLTVATVVENADNEFEMTLEKGHVRITNLTNNYTNKLTNQAEYTMTNNLYLFAQNYNGTPRFGYDRIIKYFKYYDKNNELTYDLIPCYRKIDNKIGMYNVAKKQFFKNIGEGEFTAWHGDYYVNLLSWATDKDGTIFNGIGYKPEYRVNSSGGVSDASDKPLMCAGGFIPAKVGDIVRIKGAYPVQGVAPYLVTYNSHQTLITHKQFGVTAAGKGTPTDVDWSTVASAATFYSYENGILTIPLTEENFGTGITYFRISMHMDENTIVTVNQEIPITYTNLAEPLPNNTTDTSKWVNGYRFSSSAITAQEGTTLSNHIFCKKGDVIRIKGVDLRGSADRFYVYVPDYGIDLQYWNVGSNFWTCEVVDGVYVVTITDYGAVERFRFAMPTPTDASKVIVTVNEEISTEPQPQEEVFNNWIPYSTEDDDITIYNNGLGYKDGYRVRSGGGEAENNYATATGYIPVKAGDVVRVKGAEFLHSGTENAINVYDGSLAVLGQMAGNSSYGYGIFTEEAYANYQFSSVVENPEGVFTWVVPPHADIRYMRVTARTNYTGDGTLHGDGLVVTVNEQLTFNNLIPRSTESNGKTIYNNGLGYKEGYRLNSSGVEAVFDSTVVSGFIPYNGETVELTVPTTHLGHSANYLHVYDSNFTVIKKDASGATIDGSYHSLNQWVSKYGATYVTEGDTMKFTIPSSLLAIDGVKYLRASSAVVNLNNETFNLKLKGYSTIDLYSGIASAYKLNYRYSGTSIVAKDGAYLTDIIPVNFKTRPYLNIKGFYNGYSGAAPFIVRIGFYKGSTLSNVQYCTNILTDSAANQGSINMSAYKDYDGIQFEIYPSSTGATLTTASVIPSSQVSIKNSTSALY